MVQKGNWCFPENHSKWYEVTDILIYIVSLIVMILTHRRKQYQDFSVTLDF